MSLSCRPRGHGVALAMMTASCVGPAHLPSGTGLRVAVVRVTCSGSAPLWFSKYEFSVDDGKALALDFVSSDPECGLFYDRPRDQPGTPLACITQEQAVDIARRMTGDAVAVSASGVATSGTWRLPSRAEWACMAGQAPRGAPCLGNNVADHSLSLRQQSRVLPYFSCSDGYALLAPVWALSANENGAVGVWGNVREWLSEPGQYAGSSAFDGPDTAFEPQLSGFWSASAGLGMRPVLVPSVATVN